MKVCMRQMLLTWPMIWPWCMMSTSRLPKMMPWGLNVYSTYTHTHTLTLYSSWGRTQMFWPSVGIKGLVIQQIVQEAACRPLTVASAKKHISSNFKTWWTCPINSKASKMHKQEFDELTCSLSPSLTCTLQRQLHGFTFTVATGYGSKPLPPLKMYFLLYKLNSCSQEVHVMDT